MPGTHFMDSVEFNDANNRTQVPRASQFTGMPVGIEIAAKYLVRDFAFLHANDIPGAAAHPGLGWTVTETGAGGAITLSADLVPPRLIVTNDALDNDSEEAQFAAANAAGEMFSLRTGKRLYFRCQFSLSDANNNLATVQQTDLFLGLSIRDTAVIDGSTDFIGFSKIDGSGLVNFVAGKNAGAGGALIDQIVTSTGITLTATDAGVTESDLHTFEFLALGTNTVFVYADGRHVATVASSTQLPDDENLCPTIAFQNGEAVIKVMNLTQLLYAMER